jgi:hypothetical protein
MKKQITFAANRPSPIASTSPSHFLTPGPFSLATPSQVLEITNLNQVLIEQTPASTPSGNDQTNAAKYSCPESSNTLATSLFSLTTLLQEHDFTHFTPNFMKKQHTPHSIMPQLPAILLNFWYEDNTLPWYETPTCLAGYYVWGGYISVLINPSSPVSFAGVLAPSFAGSAIRP